MTYLDLIGYIAAFLSCCAFIPQAWLTWKQKRATGISLGMYCMMVSGVICWLTYGILLNAYPIIIANIISLIFTAFILVMKLIYK